MADVARQCSHCSHIITVSEYADVTALQCPVCRETGFGEVHLESGEEQTAGPVATVRPGLRVLRPPPEPEPELPPEAAAYEIPTFVKSDRITRWFGPMRWRLLLPLVPWAGFFVFLLIAGMLLKLRSQPLAGWLMNLR